MSGSGRSPGVANRLPGLLILLVAVALVVFGAFGCAIVPYSSENAIAAEYAAGLIQRAEVSGLAWSGAAPTRFIPDPVPAREGVVTGWLITADESALIIHAVTDGILRADPIVFSLNIAPTGRPWETWIVPEGSTVDSLAPLVVRLARGDQVELHYLAIGPAEKIEPARLFFPSPLRTATVYVDPDTLQTTLRTIRQEDATWVEEVEPLLDLGTSIPPPIVFDNSVVLGLASAGHTVELVATAQRSYLSLRTPNNSQWSVFTWGRDNPVVVTPWVAGRSTFEAPPIWIDDQQNLFYTARSGSPQIYDEAGQTVGRQTLGPLSREGHVQSDQGILRLYSVVSRERTLSGWSVRITLYTAASSQSP